VDVIEGPKDDRPDAAVPRPETPESSAGGATIDARTRELDLIQSLGRLAAEAQRPGDLFRATISVLERAEELDLAMIASQIEGEREIVCFLARPFERACIERLARHAGRMLDWPAESELPRIAEAKLDEFDRSRRSRRDYGEQELVVVPILRRSSAVACLLYLPTRRAGEAQLRLLYSAANQLGVHLDRILAMREAEANRFRAILDTMPQAVFLADAQLRIVQRNRAARDLLARMGLSEATDLDDAIARLGLETIVERVQSSHSAVADDETRLDDGATFNVSVSPLAGTGHDAGGLVLVLSDVTESRRMQEQLAQSEKMSSLGQMISGTAHELNNPLASVLGYVQLLRATAGQDEKLASRFELIRREAERCQKIVQNLLAFARQRPPERKPFSINEVIHSVLSLMGYQLRTSGVKVSEELSSELPAFEGDPHQLQQVLVNLMTNAQQAIRQAQEAGEIRVRTETREGNHVVVEIHDSGPGIPEDVRSRIFDPFFTTKEEGKGTGLGLSIVYGIVISHGGTIEARPSELGGACFRITFPVGVDEGAEERGTDAAAANATHETGRVLVVDDEEPLAQMICEALGREGHRAVAVADGRLALEKLARDDYDLIISDMKMPGMDAERMLEEIGRRHPELAERVLLMTGDTVNSEPEEFAARASLELVAKPFDLDELLSRVRKRLCGSKKDR
jgi:two-component system NtrC family sensor kinase